VTGCEAFLCDPDDPVAQLLAETVADGTTLTVVQRTDVIAGIADRVTVVGQTRFLAIAADISAIDLPCRVILRRADTATGLSEWHAGLRLLAEVVRLSPNRQITLLAVTDQAAAEIAAVIGMPVGVVPALPAVFSNRATGTLHGDTITLTNGSRMGASSVNWARLRRNVVLVADGSDDLRDILAWMATAAPAHAPTQSPRYVCVVPNGVGLGHITRLIAVCDALSARGAGDIVFWCFSQAAGIVEAAGYPVILRQTAAHLGLTGPGWFDWETAEFAAFLRQFRPAAVIEDAADLNPFVCAALRSPGCGEVAAVLIRRAMWQAEADAGPLDSAQHCDLILEPGELAAEVDRGPTPLAPSEISGFSRLLRTEPVTLSVGNEAIPRRSARRELALGFGATCLVSLGGDAFVGRSMMMPMVTQAARAAGVRLYWVRSPLSRNPRLYLDEIAFHHLYPLGRYLPAFDGIITATGYNSFHEAMMRATCPVLLSPTVHPKLDDQAARARFAQAQGWADWLDPEAPETHPDTLARFFRAVRRKAAGPARPVLRQGADAMADAILDLHRGKGGAA
jgi:hypothetical protein